VADISHAAGGLIGVVLPMGSSTQVQAGISSHLDDDTGVLGEFGGTKERCYNISTFC
jgi:hypothetical protein